MEIVLNLLHIRYQPGSITQLLRCAAPGADNFGITLMLLQKITTSSTGSMPVCKTMLISSSIIKSASRFKIAFLAVSQPLRARSRSTCCRIFKIYKSIAPHLL